MLNSAANFFSSFFMWQTGDNGTTMQCNVPCDWFLAWLFLRSYTDGASNEFRAQYSQLCEPISRNSQQHPPFSHNEEEVKKTCQWKTQNVYKTICFQSQLTFDWIVANLCSLFWIYVPFVFRMPEPYSDCIEGQSTMQENELYGPYLNVNEEYDRYQCLAICVQMQVLFSLHTFISSCCNIACKQESRTRI